MGSTLTYAYTYHEREGWTVRITWDRTGAVVLEQGGFTSLPEAIAWRPRRLHLTICYIDGIKTTLTFFTLSEAFECAAALRAQPLVKQLSLRSIPLEAKNLVPII